MDFQTILMPKVILAKFSSQKSTHLNHSYLKYALGKIEEKYSTKHLEVKVHGVERC